MKTHSFNKIFCPNKMDIKVSPTLFESLVNVRLALEKGEEERMDAVSHYSRAPGGQQDWNRSVRDQLLSSEERKIMIQRNKPQISKSAMNVRN